MTGDTPPTTTTPRRSRRWIAGLGILVALGVVGLVVVTVANRVVYSPEARVNAYLDALAARDTGAVFDLLRPDLPVEEQALLTPDVLRSTRPVIADVELGDVRVDGDRATVTADATVDAEPVRFSLVLEKVGSRFGVVDDWKITDPGFGSVRVRAPQATSLDVNGVDVTVQGLDDGVTLAVFPGQYEIVPVTDLPMADYGPASTQTVLDQAEQVSFRVGPDDALAAAVTSQADAYLDACFAQTVARPAGCPNYIPADIRADEIRWDVGDRPENDVVPNDAGGWDFTTDGGVGSYTAIYTAGPGDPGGDFARRYVYRFGGRVDVQGDTATIEVTDTYTPTRLGADIP